ncbi:hypothetical protein TGAMA5MH_05170 [Trichoderma gamsii]|uniref:Uncharacterized protein n=1 Tax=Trichoderma gamsii TaxID=398673 RepID=A0A2K0TA69_9HYPO|nr:hypothetical protein TGAMA5MH_05170 [Trichoderma gamsii]
MPAAAMPDDGRQASTASPAKPGLAASSGVSLGHGNSNSNASAASPGHFIRRAKTFDEPSMRSGSMSRHFSDSSSEALPRRSSNFSEYSLNEARDILNPRPHALGEQPSHQESSPLAFLSLAFAFLPAVAGVFFQNGTSVVTDIMLLGLAAILLHWSVTQPWQWYHAAQEVRLFQENSVNISLEEDSDLDSRGKPPSTSAPLDDVPEEREGDGMDDSSSAKREAREKQQMTEQQQAALKELYRHESLALVSCFAMPLLSAYLLHYIRGQLSRPSEGLVSNFNLTIFLLAAELRVLSHMITLVQSRTLHLQKVVHENPFGQQVGAETLLEEMLRRLERLESRSTSQGHEIAGHGQTLDSTAATISRDVRNTIQPELDALNRAVRRYEKKATLLQLQTESRFSQVHVKLDDAISLAAAAVKNTNRRRDFIPWAWKWIVAIVTFPFKALLEILALPLKPIVAFANRNKPPSATSLPPSRSRAGKSPASLKYNGDRVPTRLTKR